QYWKRRGIPGPSSRLYYGNSKELTNFNEPSPFQIYEWTKKYGPIYGIKEGVHNMLVISDIQLLNEVFVKQFDTYYARREPALASDPDSDPRMNLFGSRGSRWKRLRTLASPSFSTNSLKKIMPIVEDSAIKLVDLMGTKHGGGEAFDASRYFNEFTLDTICRLVLGQKESNLFGNPKLESFKSIFLVHFDRPIIHLALALPQIAPVLREIGKRSNLPATRNVRELLSDIEKTVRKRVEERKECGPPSTPADFIDIFLENEAEIDYKNHGEFSTQDRVQKAITVDEVIGQVFVFLLAGYDTTSNALSYATWLLSRNQEVMRRCQEEVDEVCGDSSISFDDCQQLRYLDAACKETLRLFPLAAKGVNRIPMKNTTIVGHEIEKGTTILADTYAIHFSKELWGEDAEEFRPERWLDPEKRVAAINFLSFGAGPRLCVGMRLALMEEKILLAHILRRFDILADDKMSNLKLIGCTTISPESVPVKIRSRN
ncbi:hypothetical protein PMAYCL1PPCAC_15208, partial [Pristionchus mayeri]